MHRFGSKAVLTRFPSAWPPLFLSHSPTFRRRNERGDVDKFEVPPELQYTIVNMEETILDQ